MYSLYFTLTVALHILSGEYDWSATPEKYKLLHKQVEGSTYTFMEEVGHFPMSENPEKFKTYLMPVLEKVIKEA